MRFTAPQAQAIPFGAISQGKASRSLRLQDTGLDRGPRRNPAQRFRWGEDEQ